MRNVLIFFAVLLGLLAGYAYVRNPAGCQKLLNNAGSVVTSLSPFSQHAGATLPTPAPPAPQVQPPAATPAPASVSVVPTPPAPPPIKAWAPPDVMPAQPNWTWTTTYGDTYQNVVVTKIEPDTVSITHSLGVADIPIKLLPPDIQKKLNYVPAAAAVTAAPPPSAAPANPSPDANKPWAPPDVMPAQPNWTWTTTYGDTYQNVVVTKIEPDTVSITHSLGVAHIPINLLPPDIQKKLGYDPAAAVAMRAETERESEHPYYTMEARAEAQSVARQMHWPLAWVSSMKEYLTVPDAGQPDNVALTHLALNYLKDKSIIIFIDAKSEMGLTPAIVHHQFSAYDDGALAGGANYIPPKVVFSNPDATQIYSRVSYTQMKATGAYAINDGLAAIPKDSDIPSPSNGQTAGAPTPPSSAPTAAPVSAAPSPAPVTTAPPPSAAPANPSPDANKP